MLFTEDSPFYSDLPMYTLLSERDYNEEASFQKELFEQQKLPTIAVKKYTKYYDIPINSQLRKGLGSSLIQDVQEMTALVATVNPMPPTMLFRGIVPWTTFQPGMRFIDNGFMSKTIDINYAVEFSGAYCCILALGYPNESQQLFIDPLSEFSNEFECLTYPGEEFEVIDQGEFQGRTLYYCRFVKNNYMEPIINPKYDSMWKNTILPWYHQLLHTKSPAIIVMKSSGTAATSTAVFIFDDSHDYLGVFTRKYVPYMYSYSKGPYDGTNESFRHHFIQEYLTLNYTHFCMIDLGNVYKYFNYRIDKSKGSELRYTYKTSGILTEKLLNWSKDFENLIISFIEETFVAFMDGDNEIVVHIDKADL